jgi:hypothetical protein
VHRSVTIDCARITDWSSCHDVFASGFGFPEFFGRNRDAWIDCMTRLDEKFSAVQVDTGTCVVLHLVNGQALKQTAPDVLAGLFEMAAFVNFRRIEVGEEPILILSCDA